MNGMSYHKEKVAAEGFFVVDDVYTASETEAILQAIAEADISGPSFRKSEDLFRAVVGMLPGLQPGVPTTKIWTSKLSLEIILQD
jgi:hypothetical protein